LFIQATLGSWQQCKGVKICFARPKSTTQVVHWLGFGFRTINHIVIGVRELRPDGCIGFHGQSVDQLLRKINRTPSTILAEVVSFCLKRQSSHHRKWRQQAPSNPVLHEQFYQEQMQEYYENVYLPIQKIFTFVCTGKTAGKGKERQA